MTISNERFEREETYFWYNLIEVSYLGKHTWFRSHRITRNNQKYRLHIIALVEAHITISSPCCILFCNIFGLLRFYNKLAPFQWVSLLLFLSFDFNLRDNVPLNWVSPIQLTVDLRFVCILMRFCFKLSHNDFPRNLFLLCCVCHIRLADCVLWQFSVENVVFLTSIYDTHNSK